ncbi:MULTISPECIES: MurR/RpiR family transcriptional regulator [unclassified Roseivivax]|uniref:MurR/RpiR family transcriptional regulator n=1 Tax=Roseivivax sp. GX 12232 TaxID=2900547 RepID=UPI001E58020B|nr:MurR/RpiR family transcriptional regulator [Roseivivax sp. GX 12232]MCE0506554.1 MurR/RpiR family transcriptional regulator [Roseivivax sp. GX 12232]
MDDLRRALRAVAASGAPRVADLAHWLSDQPEEIAFNSVRGLADRSGANANTVVRLAHALGFGGYDACRSAFQDALRHGGDIYGRRADKLHGRPGPAAFEALREAAHRNLATVFSDETREAVERAAELMIGARRIHVIGVRSCFAIADYLVYTLRMAVENVGPRTGAPGDIRDQIAGTGPEDAVLSITFPHYSIETVAAHELARQRGARTIAVTDGPGAPTARGADVLLCPGMHGPQPLPSMIAAFALTEALTAAMILRSEGAHRNVARFEQRLMEAGAYWRG